MILSRPNKPTSKQTNNYNVQTPPAPPSRDPSLLHWPRCCHRWQCHLRNHLRLPTPTDWLMYIINVGPRGPCLCIQDNPDVNGRPGCTLFVNHGRDHLKISICGWRGSRYTYADIQESLKRLVGECTKTFDGYRKTGGKFIGHGGQVTIFVHL